jgi:hypothetical protein
MFVPHIGQEVLVAFMEGDPDRPVEIGRVYNGDNKPPLTLPANGYKSIIRDAFSNEIILDGTPGEEHITFHSPSHNSFLQLGKSIKKFTSSEEATYSYDSTTYSFGKKITYTKGWSWSVDRGAWGSIKAGIGLAVTVGADLKVSLANAINLTGGAAFTYFMNSSLSYGFSRELKFTKGAYKRMSGGNAILDSAKDACVAGGANDNTILVSNDEEIYMSFDDTSKNRPATAAALDAKAKGITLALVGGGTTASIVGALWHNHEVKVGKATKQPDGKFATMMDASKISGLTTADIVPALATAASLATIGAGLRHEDAAIPKHSKPSAKVYMHKDFVRIFAGDKQETEILLAKDDGIMMMAKKTIEIKSEDDAMTLSSKGELKLHSDDAVNIDAEIKHKNITVKK